MTAHGSFCRAPYTTDVEAETRSRTAAENRTVAGNRTVIDGSRIDGSRIDPSMDDGSMVGDWVVVGARSEHGLGHLPMITTNARAPRSLTSKI